MKKLEIKVEKHEKSSCGLREQGNEAQVETKRGYFELQRVKTYGCETHIE
ncbi:MAG: hypothetical protein PHW73_10150 [Atribacterota bacterium]|nr:hypothetical protein [Atribacterota bacterium]